MQTKIKFYKDRVAVNFLAKDKKNGADVFNAWQCDTNWRAASR